MTKADLVAAIFEKAGDLSQKQAAEVVEAALGLIKETLGRGEPVKVSSFGNFVLRDKKERTGRNPQTGEPIVIESRRVLTFQPSDVLRERMNAPATDAPA